MIETIVAVVVGGLILALVTTACSYTWKHRRNARRRLAGIPRRLVTPFRRKETEEEKEARRFWDMLDSDDPDIWTPLS